MATGKVTVQHENGGLGNSQFIADRIHAKVGQAEGGTANKIEMILNGEHAKSIFVQGALVDSLVQYFEEFDENLGQVPQPVLCVRPDNDVAGSVDAAIKDAGTGIAALPTTAGVPTGSRLVFLKFTKAGAHGTAEFRRSTDGGVTYEAPLVTPASGSPITLAAGVTATFVDDGATPPDTFHADDIYRFVINGPSPSVASKLTAGESLLREYRLRMTHFIGGVDRAFAEAVKLMFLDMETLHDNPAFAILEAKSFAEQMAPGAAETAANIDLYYQQIDAEFDPFYDDRVAIVPVRGRYIPGGIAAAGGYDAIARSGPAGVWRNAATLLTAHICAGPVNESAAYVKRHRSRTMVEVEHWDAGYQNWMDTLHDKGFTVLKEYNNFEGIYLARDLIKSHPDSDFRGIPERRRADKMDRILYQASLPYLNADTGITDLDYVGGVVRAAVSAKMMNPTSPEISGFDIVLDPDGTFQSTGTLMARMSMSLANRIGSISWTTTMSRA